MRKSFCLIDDLVTRVAAMVFVVAIIQALVPGIILIMSYSIERALAITLPVEGLVRSLIPAGAAMIGDYIPAIVAKVLIVSSIVPLVPGIVLVMSLKGQVNVSKGGSVERLIVLLPAPRLKMDWFGSHTGREFSSRACRLPACRERGRYSCSQGEEGNKHTEQNEIRIFFHDDTSYSFILL